jgi:hypothetical protein
MMRSDRVCERGKTMGKTMGKSWENWEIVGNCGKMWDNHGKIMGKCRIIREMHYKRSF